MSHHDPSALRFHLRDLVIVVTAASVALAAATPWLRQIEVAKLLRCGVPWLFAGTGFASVAIGYGWLRDRAKRQGGNKEYTLARVGSSLAPVVAFSLLGAFSLGLLVFRTYAASASEYSTDGIAVATLVGLSQGAQLGICFAFLRWRPRVVELRQNGIRTGWAFVDWQRLSHHWKQADEVLVLSTIGFQIRLTVPRENQAAIRDFLEEVNST